MKKIAIIFGINEYLYTDKLNFAINDAEELNRTLQKLEFDTKLYINVDVRQMGLAIAEFKSVIIQYDIGLFYFAGHGFQVDNSNYLATIDTSFEDESTAKYTAFKLDDVINDMSGLKIRILIIDACRDKPFRARGGTAGFAPVNAPKGTIIGFGTSPGQVAKEANGHGLYTLAILQHIETPKITIEDMFKRVRNTVSVYTNANQITWEHTSLMGNFYFKEKVDLNNNFYYLHTAIADNDYQISRGSPLKSAIEALKSNNYNIQNKTNLDGLKEDNCDKNDIFVLGRNLYQASSNAFSITSFFGNIERYINSLNLITSIHLLNGMAFEIYFDRNGKVRKNLKLEVTVDKIIDLLLKPKFVECKNFILAQLKDDDQKIFYKPGDNEEYCFDAVFIFSENDNIFKLSKLCLDSQNVLYDGRGEYILTVDDWYQDIEFDSLEELKKFISKRTLIEIKNLKFNNIFNGKEYYKEKIAFTTNFCLLKYVY